MHHVLDWVWCWKISFYFLILVMSLGWILGVFFFFLLVLLRAFDEYRLVLWFLLLFAFKCHLLTSQSLELQIDSVHLENGKQNKKDGKFRGYISCSTVQLHGFFHRVLIMLWNVIILWLHNDNFSFSPPNPYFLLFPYLPFSSCVSFDISVSSLSFSSLAYLSFLFSLCSLHLPVLFPFFCGCVMFSFFLRLCFSSLLSLFLPNVSLLPSISFSLTLFLSLLNFLVLFSSVWFTFYMIYNHSWMINYAVCVIIM